MPISTPTGSPLREARGSDNAQYVPVPFDIVWAYHFRIFAAAPEIAYTCVSGIVYAQGRAGTRHLGRTIQDSTLTAPPVPAVLTPKGSVQASDKRKVNSETWNRSLLPGIVNTFECQMMTADPAASGSGHVQWQPRHGVLGCETRSATSGSTCSVESQCRLLSHGADGESLLSIACGTLLMI